MVINNIMMMKHHMIFLATFLVIFFAFEGKLEII